MWCIWASSWIVESAQACSPADAQRGFKMSIIWICIGVLFIYLIVVNVLRQRGIDIIDSSTDFFPALLLIILGICYVTGIAKF
jgi:hypothetical protein